MFIKIISCNILTYKDFKIEGIFSPFVLDSSINSTKTSFNFKIFINVYHLLHFYKIILVRTFESAIIGRPVYGSSVRILNPLSAKSDSESIFLSYLQ